MIVNRTVCSLGGNELQYEYPIQCDFKSGVRKMSVLTRGEKTVLGAGGWSA